MQPLQIVRSFEFLGLPSVEVICPKCLGSGCHACRREGRFTLEATQPVREWARKRFGAYSAEHNAVRARELQARCERRAYAAGALTHEAGRQMRRAGRLADAFECHNQAAFWF